MNRKVRNVTSLLLALLIALTLNGCGGSKDVSEDTENKDYTIVVGISAAITTLDPAMHRDRTTETVLRNMFDGLVTRTPDMKIVPEIAESWEAVSPTEWVFKIRQGVTFHNGEELNADDVVFTYERIMKEGGVDGGWMASSGRAAPQKREKPPGKQAARLSKKGTRYSASTRCWRPTLQDNFSFTRR